MSTENNSTDNQVVEEKTTSASSANAHDENHSEESDTTENDTESLESTDDENESTDDSKSDKGKKKGGFQKRIGKLTARATEAEQGRTLAERERDYWREQALKGKQDPGKEQAKTETKPSGKPNPDDFDTNADYIDALTDWKIEQREAKAREEREKSQSKTAEQKRIESFQSKISEFKKEFKDFDEVIDDCEIGLSKELESLVIDSDLAPQLMYDLAKKPEEIEKLNGLKGYQLAKALGVLEDRLAKEAESKKAKKTTTNAPAPISPVTAKGGTTSKKDISDPSLSFSEYERLRRQQLTKK